MNSKSKIKVFSFIFLGLFFSLTLFSIVGSIVNANEDTEMDNPKASCYHRKPK